MEIKVDEKSYLKELNCYKIELNSKPSLMGKTINDELTLVIVVDMINGFCKKGSLASPRNATVIADIQKVLDKLPKAKKVFLRDCHNNDAVEFKSFPPHCNTKGESALVSELSKYKGIDVPKNSTNGFFALLKSVDNLLQYKDIIIVGVCTDICVMQLALTLRAYINEQDNYNNVVVLTDSVETYDMPTHNADLMNMFSLKLMEQAGVGLFKDII